MGEEERASRGEERGEGEDIAGEEMCAGLGFEGLSGGELEGEGGSGGVVIPGVGREVGEVGWEGVAGVAGVAGGGAGVWEVHGCGWIWSGVAARLLLRLGYPSRGCQDIELRNSV